MLLELRGQRLVRFVVLGYHKKAAGVLVYPVDYPRTYHAVDGRERITHVVHDGVHKGAGGIARTRMHHHAAGLVYHGNITVFIDYVERDVLGSYLKRLRLRHIYSDSIAFRNSALL